MARIVFDTFTEGSNTNLESHTPEVGGTWNYLGTDAWTVIAATDRVITPATDPGILFAVNGATPPSADYWVEVTGATIGTNLRDKFGACVRKDTNTYATANGYFAFVQGDGILSCSSIVAGSENQEGTNYNIPSFSASTEYTVRLHVVGTSLTVYLDGVSRITATDSGVSATGSAGMIIRDFSTAGTYITSIDSDDGVSASSVPVFYRHLQTQGIA